MTNVGIEKYFFLKGIDEIITKNIDNNVRYFSKTYKWSAVQDILPIFMQIGLSINKNVNSGRLKSTFTYFLTFKKILILSSIYSQVP